MRKETQAIYTAYQNHGAMATGKREIFRNDEPFQTDSARVSMGCFPTGCTKSVSFFRPEEALVTESVGIGLSLDLPPGTYPIEPGNNNAFAYYAFDRKVPGDGGWWSTPYYPYEGSIKLDAYDQDTLSMSGEFTFRVKVEHLIQTFRGSFDLKERR